MPSVVHFEIFADEPERAITFYREVFGWKIEKWEGEQPYYLVTTHTDQEPGINGAILPRPEPLGAGNDVRGFVCTIDVPDVDMFVERVKSAGGSVLQGTTAIPGVGYNAQCMDTEGNLFGVMHADPSA